MKRIVSVFLAIVIVLSCLSALASSDYIPFIELYIKRRVYYGQLLKQGEYQLNPIAITSPSMVSMSGGVIFLDDDANISSFSFPRDFTKEETVSETLDIVAAISALEYSDFQDGLFKISGKDAFTEAFNIYSNEMKTKIAEGIIPAQRGDQVSVYKSDHYLYTISRGSDKNMRPTRSVYLSAIRLK